MGRSQESFNKKEVRNKKQKKRQEKEKKRLARKEAGSTQGDDLIAYVDENGIITDTPPDPDQKTEINIEDIETSIPSKGNEPEVDPVRKGTVTHFNDSKGYGFIRDSETKESVFVHINNVQDDIAEGNLVSYEVEMGHKGPTAVNVKQIK